MVPTSMNKYTLYEKSVQSPDVHLEWFVSMYKEIYEKYPRHMREDFCGTFKLSCEWIKRNRNNTALSLDLDPEPLAYGNRNHVARLSKAQKERLTVKASDVLIPTARKSELIIACNFSFYIFKKREILLKYFKSCLKSMSSKSLLILEMAGGPGMITPTKEQKSITLGKDKTKKFTYVWDQKSFDPITHDTHYAIHFKLPNGKTLKNAFTYDWRLWTIPEVRDILKEAGFGDSYVYWESTFRGKGTGEYLRTEKGDNAFAWIGYVVGKP